MDLAAALGLGADELVAFVGAGGKKTAMQRLVAEGDDRAVGYTTTTHMPPPPDLPLVLAGPDAIEEALDGAPHPVAFASERVPDPDRAAEKVRGFAPSVIDRLARTDRFEWLLVKADGARRRSFKAPDADEPAIPSTSTTVVVLASVGALGQPIEESTMHRPERIASIAGVPMGDRLTVETMARVLASDDGGLKGMPAGADAFVLLNQADTPALRSDAREVLVEIFAATDRYAGGLVSSFHRDFLERHTP